MLKQKTFVYILVIYTIIMIKISRYFDWNEIFVAFSTLYIAILMVRPIKVKYFIQDALYAIGIGTMYLSFLKNMYTMDYIIMAK